MKTSYKYIAMAIAALLCSCNKEIATEVIESQVQISADITPSILTRVTDDGTSFTNGDAIKVRNTNRENKNLATYTYSESTGKWSTSDELYWEGTSANIFHAWYPATVEYGSFTIPADQTSGTAEADWMTATVSAKKADGTVNLSFNHNLAKVTVTIDSWSNEYSANERVANALELNSLSSVMSNDGTVSGDEAAKWVKAYVAQANTSFVAIIAPGTYASGDDIMQIYVNGSSTPLAVKTSSALTIEAGKAYRFKLSVGKDLVAITSSVTINGWEDEVLDNQEIIVNLNTSVPYVDELGIMQGYGVEIDGTVWAPVNCGYHETDYPYGKLYQWGRKYGQGYSGELYVGGWNQTHSDASVPTVVEGGVSISIGQDVSNSNNYYKGISNGRYYDWFTSQDDADALWNTGTVDNPVKTEYDPCPKGWRVPTPAELKGLSKNYSSWTTKGGQNGFWFSGSVSYSESAQRVFFPAAGNRTGDVAYNRGGYGFYWSSSELNTIGFDFLEFNLSGAVGTGKTGSYQGYSVRCVLDKNSENPSELQVVNLSSEGTANSYIVSQKGSYKFNTVKGNSSVSVGAVSSAEVLWESFGTDVTPNVGDLVNNVKYADGAISFDTPSAFKEGNAVIAAKDASGTILWSWHIWLTDEPQGQEYYNNAGTMMDRNLGATSATPGDVGALGLLYQWGRKDPFLGSSNISSSTVAKSTGSWPSAVSSSSSKGTIDYAVKNPMTFITYNSGNDDWYYTGSTSTDNTRWQSAKTIYDPCPSGWRVPDGGSKDVWSKALGSSSSFDYTYNDAKEGMNFSGKFGSARTIWYPASGTRDDIDGGLCSVGDFGFYWSASPYSNFAYDLHFNYNGSVYPFSCSARTIGRSVRCLQE